MPISACSSTSLIFSPESLVSCSCTFLQLVHHPCLMPGIRLFIPASAAASILPVTPPTGITSPLTLNIRLMLQIDLLVHFLVQKQLQLQWTHWHYLLRHHRMLEGTVYVYHGWIYLYQYSFNQSTYILNCFLSNFPNLPVAIILPSSLL